MKTLKEKYNSLTKDYSYIKNDEKLFWWLLSTPEDKLVKFSFIIKYIILLYRIS